MLLIIIVLIIPPSITERINYDWPDLKMDLTGDFIIGFLADSRVCDSEYSNEGTYVHREISALSFMMELEAALIVLEEINSNELILPGVKLGMNIRNTCFFPDLAIQQSEDLLNSVLKEDDDNYGDYSAKICKNSCTIGMLLAVSVESEFLVRDFFRYRSLRFISDMIPWTNGRIPIFPVFSEAESFIKYQKRAIYDLLKKYNWTHVAVIQTPRTHKVDFFEDFGSDICIWKILLFYRYGLRSREFANKIQDLSKDTSVNVIICDCDCITREFIINTITDLKLEKRFLFIFKNLEHAVKDIFMNFETVENRLRFIYVGDIISPQPEFQDHANTLYLVKNARNWWLAEYWEREFPDEIREETGKWLFGQFGHNARTSFIIKAMWAMTHGLHNMMEKTCGVGYNGTCNDMYPFNNSMFGEYMKNLSFYRKNENVSTDQNGDIISSFEFIYCEVDKDSYLEEKIGEWKRRSLETYNDTMLDNVTSACPLCSSEQQMVYYHIHKNRSCCWSCLTCNDDEYFSKKEERCMNCLPNEILNANRTACEEIRSFERNWYEATTIMVTFLTISGLLATLITFYIFSRYKNTAVVKASSYELSCIILFGMILAHTSIFIFLSPPTVIICALSGNIPGIAFTMMFAGLYTKTRRIAKILAVPKDKFSNKKYRFMSTSAQVLIVFSCIIIEMAISGSMVVINPPKPSVERTIQGHLSSTCPNSFIDVIPPAIFVIILQVMCTSYAIKTRNVSGNFNEAKFIGFNMLLTSIMWIVFFPSFFGTIYKALVISMCATLTASITLAFLFFPKLYIILFKPEKNNREYFITNKFIRTHIGPKVSAEPRHVVESPPCEISVDNPEIPRTRSQRKQVTRRCLDTCRVTGKLCSENEISYTEQGASSSNYKFMNYNDSNNSQQDNVNISVDTTKGIKPMSTRRKSC